MLIVGLTGGIGSGKSTVAKMFEELGVPIYIADVEAKKLTNSSETIRKEILELLGQEAYNEDTLNAAYVAKRVFTDKVLLEKLNKIIHPRVGIHFKEWASKQEGPYVIKEAAILFENGGYKNCDYTILVTAPLELRIQWLLKRDDTTLNEIENRMQNQWSDSRKAQLADKIIENSDLENTKYQVESIHCQLKQHQQ